MSSLSIPVRGLIVSDASKKIRLDHYLVERGLVPSRHQAADLIRRRLVKVNQHILSKPAHLLAVDGRWRIKLLRPVHVSRAGDKLADVVEPLGLRFKQAVVLDVGAHRGGFTDCVNRLGARLIIAVDVGTQQLVDDLRLQPHIISFTKTDIRDFSYPDQQPPPDYILLDLSFISLRHILDGLRPLCQPQTKIVALVKPQFEGQRQDLSKGVVKNRAYRRRILTNFEQWLKQHNYLIIRQAEARLSGLKGNLERFYLLQP